MAVGDVMAVLWRSAMLWRCSAMLWRCYGGVRRDYGGTWMFGEIMAGWIRPEERALPHPWEGPSAG